MQKIQLSQNIKKSFKLKSSEQQLQEVVVTANKKSTNINIKPENIETALSLANDYERRIKFQADVQDYVDMSISSTINLPKWGTELNNEYYKICLNRFK